MFLAIRIAVAILFAGWLMQQVRKPNGWLGRRLVRAMSLSHAAMTDWGLQQLTVAKNASVLDVGCGGGRTVGKLAALAPEGRVVGLDYSATSVAVARDTNAGAIQAGRVEIEQGSVAALPFPDGTFDIVTAVETHYYWPNLAANVREVFRVTKPGGTFALNCRDVSRRTLGVVVQAGDGFAAGGVPDGCRAPRAIESGGI
jgi:ubiquinone/menaquinone biosynthesis C-methylase UbiE